MSFGVPTARAMRIAGSGPFSAVNLPRKSTFVTDERLNDLNQATHGQPYGVPMSHRTMHSRRQILRSVGAVAALAASPLRLAQAAGRLARYMVS